MAYARLEPFGPQQDNLRAALIATLIANANRSRRRRPIKLQAVLDVLGQPTRPSSERQTWQDQLHIVEMMNVALGGKDERGTR